MTEDDRVRSAAATALGEEPERVERLHGGANNIVARVDIRGRSLVVKLYFSHPGDPRDRLGTEFEMLSFLWRHGLRAIPEPVTADREAGVGVYAYIAGHRVAPPVTWPETLGLLELVAAMREASAAETATTLPVASDGAFDVRGRMVEIERRLARLRAAAVGDALAFVDDHLRPAATSTLAWVERAGHLLEMDLDEPIPGDQRTLSPGDIGFHNVLRTDAGSLAFLDFEYSGWDDIAQVIAQTCLAPEVPVDDDLHVPLMRELVGRLEAGAVIRRLRLLYPLLALKWSLIALNDLLDVGGERRVFAGVDSVRRWDAQLEKSRKLVERSRAATKPGSPLDGLLDPFWRSRLSG